MYRMLISPPLHQPVKLSTCWEACSSVLPHSTVLMCLLHLALRLDRELSKLSAGSASSGGKGCKVTQFTLTVTYVKYNTNSSILTNGNNVETKDKIT